MHVLFDEGDVASGKPRRESLLYKNWITMMMAALLGAVGVCGYAAETAQVELAGAWQVRAGTQVLAVTPNEPVQVKGERWESVPLSPQRSGWRAGRRFSALLAYECSVKGALLPSSVVVKKLDGTVMAVNKDYCLEREWGAISRCPTGRLGEKDAVLIDYAYRPQRLDRLVRTQIGTCVLRTGKPKASNPELPALALGDTPLATVWLDGATTRLTSRNLYPVVAATAAEVPPEGPCLAAQLLPKTYAKLTRGESVTVLAWGDSVTDASYLANPARDRWQEQFVRRLRTRFPKSDIKLVTNGWGGRQTATFLDVRQAPSGHPHNYVETVLNAKADLVVMEFVNDANLVKYEDLKARYDRIRADLTGKGAELCVLTPHYTRGDWMGLSDPTTTTKDPRPYVANVRRWCAETKTALADASKLWGELAGRGIPYQTLLVNEINHPNPFGLSLFADALMDLFRGTLLWHDEFNGTALDARRWNRCVKGPFDWNRMMSSREDLVQVKDGQLIMWGVRNDDKAKDPRPFLTGGVTSQRKGTLKCGRIEIRVKFEDQVGAWPALWMKPDVRDGQGREWPWDGEIDIVERLNGDPFVYQTVHTGWTLNKRHGDTPPHGNNGKGAAIIQGDWNVYALTIAEDALVWSVNGEETFRYPKINCGDPDQWPFQRQYYVLMDMQLGGAWVGKVKPATLPVRMYIDWIRVYE